MKKMQKIVVVGALLINLSLLGLANAAAPPYHRGGGPDVLGKYLMENQMAQVLSEITKQPVETMRLKLKGEHLRDVLHEYKIDPEAFHNAMSIRMAALVNGLEKTGYITSDQRKDIIEKMESRAQRHALMKRLIEKGIKDGTITKEQSQLLLPPPH
jgi:hypothetical protein